MGTNSQSSGSNIDGGYNGENLFESSSINKDDLHEEDYEANDSEIRIEFQNIKSKQLFKLGEFDFKTSEEDKSSIYEFLKDFSDQYRHYLRNHPNPANHTTF